MPTKGPRPGRRLAASSIAGGSQTLVPSSVSYIAAQKRANLDPASDLEPGGSYVATERATDLSGNPLVERKNFRFTVAR